jgi:hypothetical protein
MEKRGGVEHMELAMPDMVQLLTCKGKGWLAACYFWCGEELGHGEREEERNSWAAGWAAGQGLA